MLEEYKITEPNITLSEDYDKLLKDLKNQNAEFYEGDGFLAFRGKHFDGLNVKVIAFHKKNLVTNYKITLSDDFTKEEAYKLREKLEKYYLEKYGKQHKVGTYQNEETDQVCYCYFEDLITYNYLNIIDDKEPRVIIKIDYNNESKKVNNLKPVFILSGLAAALISIIAYVIFGLTLGFNVYSLITSLLVLGCSFGFAFLFFYYKKENENKKSDALLTKEVNDLIDSYEEHIEDKFDGKVRGLILGAKKYQPAAFYFTEEALLINYLFEGQVYRSTVKYQELGKVNTNGLELFFQFGNAMLLFRFKDLETLGTFIKYYHAHQVISFELK